MIYAKRPFLASQVCLKITTDKSDDREVSICCDDSCGAFQDLLRSDIRLFDGVKDVTSEVFSGRAEPGTAESLIRALEWLTTGSCRCNNEDLTICQKCGAWMEQSTGRHFVIDDGESPKLIRSCE